MMRHNLEQAVRPGDSILTWAPDENPHMLIVKSIIGNENSSADPSSIIVTYTHSHIPAQPGSWKLDGPNIVYFEKIHEEGEVDFVGPFDKPLSSYTQDFNQAGDAGALRPDMKILVNPHGRDVLKYYFGKTCPECDGESYICPGCGGVSQRWPDHFTSCGFDLSCPFCMGYDFALEDKTTLENLGELYLKANSLKESGPEELYQEIQEIGEEWLSGHRARYEWVNTRREEMGLLQNNIDAIMAEKREDFDFIRKR